MSRLPGLLLLAAPAVLAFVSGGFFARPQLVAGVLAWLAVAGVLLLAPRPLPRTPRGLAALAGLAGLAGWSAASIAWAPQADPALADSERIALYVAVLVCALALLRRDLRAVEPVLAAGIVVVIGYALLTRLLPGVVPSERSNSAGGRLEQPLTYWNALGALGAMGAVLLVRMASDDGRAARLRFAAAACTPLVLLALWMTVSRGSLAAFGVGALVLVVLGRDRATLEALAVAGLCGGAAVLATLDFTAFQDLRGDAADRRQQGLVALAVLAACCAAAAALPRALRGRRATVAAIVGGLALATVAAATWARSIEEPAERIVFPSGGPTGTTLPSDTSRLQTLQSNRYDYWETAWDGFADAPLAGQGAHAFAVLWLEQRPINEPVQDAHSLYFETAAELGVVGVALLLLFLGGSAASAFAARRGRPDGRELTAGWIAAGAVWIAHASIDWDWEMPAVTLVFLLLAGAALAADDEHVRQ